MTIRDHMLVVATWIMVCQIPIMTFEPNRSGNPAGTSRAKRQALKTLASTIREGVSPESIRDWLVEVWMGRDPATGEAVDMPMRQQALRILLERGWGMPVQKTVIDAEIRNLTGAPVTVVMPTMTLEQINARREALRGMGVKAKVIDADSQPTPQPQLPERTE